MLPILILSMLILQCFTTEMDMMSFGEEQALSMGVDLKRVKLLLIGIAALLTGTAVSLVGVIGFVDLVAPHIVRRIFGSAHRLVLPLSALFGGAFLTLAEAYFPHRHGAYHHPGGRCDSPSGCPVFLRWFSSGSGNRNEVNFLAASQHICAGYGMRRRAARYRL